MPITVLAVVIFLFDLLVAYNSWAYKPWTQIVASEDGGFRVISLWHWSDTLILIAVALFQIALACALYRSWGDTKKA
jgi:hypothetical protein